MWHNLLSPNTRSVWLDAAAAWHGAILTQVGAVGVDSSPRGRAVDSSPRGRAADVSKCPTSLQTNAHFLWHPLWDKKTEIVEIQHSNETKPAVTK